MDDNGAPLAARVRRIISLVQTDEASVARECGMPEDDLRRWMSNNPAQPHQLREQKHWEALASWIATQATQFPPHPTGHTVAEGGSGDEGRTATSSLVIRLDPIDLVFRGSFEPLQQKKSRPNNSRSSQRCWQLSSGGVEYCNGVYVEGLGAPHGARNFVADSPITLVQASHTNIDSLRIASQASAGGGSSSSAPADHHRGEELTAYSTRSFKAGEDIMDYGGELVRDDDRTATARYRVGLGNGWAVDSQGRGNETR